jgi:hypothetical protein
VSDDDVSLLRGQLGELFAFANVATNRLHEGERGVEAFAVIVQVLIDIWRSAVCRGVQGRRAHGPFRLLPARSLLLSRGCRCNSAATSG